MASLANALDFIGECMSAVPAKGKSSNASVNLAGMKSMMAVCYLLMTTFLVCVSDYAQVPGLPMFSYTFFTGSSLQFFSYMTLYVRIKGNKSAAGISSQSLFMHAISLFIKVTATISHDGYLPADNTGDMMIQLVDCCSLMTVIYLLYAMHKQYVHTYQADQDDFPITHLLLSAAVCAVFIHADLDRCFWMDSVWAFGLNVEVFQMLPQLHMLVKVGGIVDGATAHYVVNQFLGLLCRFSFWIWAISGCEELSSPEGIGWNMEVGGYYILGAHTIAVLISCDFMYHYVKAMMQGGWTSNVILPKDTVNGSPLGHLEL